MNLRQLNAELARALGVHDLRCVMKIVLTIEADKVPTVEVVSRLAVSADGLQTAVEMLKLEPSKA